jgi:hypothetical protein
MEPRDLIVRCLAYQTGRGTWVAKCVDLNLVTEDPTFEEAREVLYEMIATYIVAVFDTKDRDSIPRLLRRKSPLSDRILFKLIGFANWIRHRGDRIRVFWEAFPIHAGAACH